MQRSNRPARRRGIKCWILAGLGLGVLFAPTNRAAAQADQPAATGRLAGRIIDRATARPITGARVSIVGRPGAVETDLDGRYRTPPLAVGRYQVRGAYIGYQPFLVDSVMVKAGETTVINFTLTVAPVQLEELIAEAAVPQRAASSAGLLAQQQAAASVSDGISAETMQRTPDADASNAIARVTGISVVDKKFVVVRGLSERYSSTLLNGTEVSSPEPLKKIVPLDLFPANLLESVVTTKGATPDKPGDFAGGLVEIKTKEFPESFVAQIRVSEEYNSTSTGTLGAFIDRRRLDFLGFDDRGRASPLRLPTGSSSASEIERFAESLRNVWTPTESRAVPNLGLGFNVGGQIPIGSSAIGVVAAFSYSTKQEVQPERLFQFVTNTESGEPDRGLVFNEAQALVDWGGILNLSGRVGSYHKFGFKNFYTRSAEDVVLRSTGFDLDKSAFGLERYQVKYIERDLVQSQLSGEHFVPAVANSRIEWKVGLNRANRDEPDNRSMAYLPQGTNGALAVRSNSSNPMWFRFLDDKTFTGQLDWSLPFSLRVKDDALVKVGALARNKDRQFAAAAFDFNAVAEPPDGASVLELPPEQLLAPENVGRNIVLRPNAGLGLPYDATDDLYAIYGMIDAEPIKGFRIVGGLRVDDWRLRVAPASSGATVRNNRDYLWSTNVQICLTASMALRGSVARTVTRPDPRELALDEYASVEGECTQIGDSTLVRTQNFNSEVRWEFYPRAGELISVGAFYKRFNRPVVERVSIQASGNCRGVFINADSATNVGAEIEMRKHLSFLPGVLSSLHLGLNATFIQTRMRGIVEDSAAAANIGALPLVGQSPFLFNGSLSFLRPEWGFDATLLVNHFDDRIVRYGAVSNAQQIPNQVEAGRTTVDFKASKTLGQVSVSFSGKNLTNEPVLIFQKGAKGPVTNLFYRPGYSVSFGVGYDF